MTNRSIVFEGIDGSGKSTQANLLAQNLSKLGHNVIQTREPGSPLMSLQVRDLLLDKDNPICQRARELLFEADRAEHTTKIKELLEQGNWVISDRSFISGLTYSFCGDIPIEETWGLMQFAIQCWPSIVFYVDLDAKTAASRRNARNEKTTYEEAKGIEFMERVRQEMTKILNYLDGSIPCTLPNFPRIPVVYLDGHMPIEILETNVISELQLLNR